MREHVETFHVNKGYKLAIVVFSVIIFKRYLHEN